MRRVGAMSTAQIRQLFIGRPKRGETPWWKDIITVTISARAVFVKNSCQNHGGSTGRRHCSCIEEKICRRRQYLATQDPCICSRGPYAPPAMTTSRHAGANPRRTQHRRPWNHIRKRTTVGLRLPSPPVVPGGPVQPTTGRGRWRVVPADPNPLRRAEARPEARRPRRRQAGRQSA
jgi:hypothetical protein